MIAVPANADKGQCKSCGAEVFWIRTAAGKPMPIDCAVPDGVAPVRGVTLGADTQEAPRWARDGAGLPHFATCPNAAQHRTKKAQP